MLSGFVDCSWDLHVFPTNTVPCGSEKLAVGCTWLGAKIIFMTKTAYENDVQDKYGNTILEHEKKHAVCDCNWHKNYDQKLESGNYMLLNNKLYNKNELYQEDGIWIQKGYTLEEWIRLQ